MASTSTNPLQTLIDTAVQFYDTNYMLIPRDFPVDVRMFINNINSNLLREINAHHITAQDFKNKLQEYQKYPIFVFYIATLTDKNGISFKDIISILLDSNYERNPLKKQKLEHLLAFLDSPLDYTPQDINIRLPPGSPR
jgi:hypothetical protein